MSAPLVNTHPDAFRLKQPDRSFFWRFDGANLYLLRTAINDPDGTWDTSRPLYVNADSGQVYLGPDTKINGTLYVGDARVHTNGNIYGIAWGGWLSDYLNIQFGARDNNINVRATIDWVNQNFVQNIDLTTPETIQFWDGKGWPRVTDGAAMYNFQMVGGSSNVGWFQVRYTRKRINGTWHVIN
ncbi:hypothetical protein A4F97_18445 [Salmonella enterica]|uniref:Uncharacterized protein n=1 Tax=Salmonella enterica TaxID=28901 RepID=A0A3K0P6P8_SALER|nr:hypothetical protein [Salmonella enterica]EDY2177148.1 hypothetical protein [Salmonella enterica subsp. enterica serovar SI Rough:r:1,5]EAX4719066.1 hypothetical protein [Salmonella enterica]EAY8894510.1 hypothetical protein [Salmonella enterica]EAY8900569.1 hypothetical protein [Salmonella enterica]